MKRRVLFCVFATTAVILQGYFFTGLVPFAAPSLVSLVLLAAIVRYPFNFLLGISLWLGIVMEVISTGPFGVYLLAVLSAALLMYWLSGKGLVVDNFFNVASVLFIAIAWQVLVVFAAAGSLGAWPLIYGGLVVLLQFLMTVVFAWPLRRFVQLR